MYDMSGNDMCHFQAWPIDPPVPSTRICLLDLGGCKCGGDPRNWQSHKMEAAGVPE